MSVDEGLTTMEQEDLESLIHRAELCAKQVPLSPDPHTSLHCAIKMLQIHLKQPGTPMAKALVQSKIGIYYIKVNDSDHAQEAFNEALNYFFPQLAQFASACSASDACQNPEKIDIDVGGCRIKVQELVHAESHAKNVLDGPFRNLVIDMLIQLGMLSYERSDSIRALCFFCACEKLCSDSSSSIIATQTQIQFYLAQVYGSLQCHFESATYCVLTLAYQLRSRLSSQSQTLLEFDLEDWISNALELVQFLLERGSQTYPASVMLLASEVIINQEKIALCDAKTKSRLAAEVQLLWALLQQRVLEQAYDADIKHGDNVSVKEMVEVLKLMLDLKNQQTSIWLQLEHSGEVIMQFEWSKSRYLDPVTICSYNDAVKVFCLGMKACEDAKNYFQLDGFVSTHIRICQIQSKLFDRLSRFESDPKRQYSVQLRRYQTLRTILEADINVNAFGDLVQQVAYEGGEILANLYDRKSALEVSRSDSGSSSGKGIMHASRAILYYEKYVRCFYAPDTTGTPRGNSARLPKDAKSMSADDMRNLLLGYFALARLYSKISFKTDAVKTRDFWRIGLEYFEAIVHFKRKFTELHESEGCKLHEQFKTEFTLTEEMLQLLPEKINQLMYRGNQL